MKIDPAIGALPTPSALRALLRQAIAFVGVGLVAFALHYGLLIALVEAFGVAPVTGALAGYAAGGLVSYALNRNCTFASDRPHVEAGWRFAAVAVVGLGLTFAVMTALTRRLGVPYLPAQVATTGLVMIWSFWANRLWTFADRPMPVMAPAAR